ncbi:MAG: SRPBCC family protein [Phenylobacterium sp.]|nr:SRPBCC family protein [Phenylobacterium sp.]
MPQSLLGAEFRDVVDGERDGMAVKIVRAARTYDTDPHDLWDAVTNAERLPRWFAPVSGDLRLGGRYQVEGNAGGSILRCEPPTLLDVTWEFGGGASWVVVRIVEDGEGARLTLEHIVRAEDLDGDHWKQFGPAAVGVGWDLSFLGLGLYLATGSEKPIESDPAWGGTNEAKSFMTGSAEAWGAAHIASGEDPATARRMAAATATFYTGG